MIPSEAIPSCRELLVALLEFAGGDPAPRRHAAHVYRAYLHALRAESLAARERRWKRFVNALAVHIGYGADSYAGAPRLHEIVEQNADLVDAAKLSPFRTPGQLGARALARLVAAPAGR